MKPHEIPIIIIGIILSFFLLSVAFSNAGNEFLASIGDFIKTIVK